MPFLPTYSEAHWVDGIIGTINLVIFLVSLVIEIWAFVHCAMQRADAFPAVGTLAKQMWLLLIGGTVLLSFFFSFFSVLFSLIALTAALVYLLDIKPAIRDITSGGHW